MTHFRFSLALLTAAGIALLPHAQAHADLSGDLRISLKNKDEEQQLQAGKIYLQGDADDKERNVRVELQPDSTAEAQGSEAVIISRPADKVGYMIFPSLKSYMKLDLEEARTKGGSGPNIEDIDRSAFKKVGEEKVGGFDTVVKEAPVMDAGKKIGTVTVYQAKKLNDEAIKSVFREENGRVTETLIENPSTKKLASNLFAPPADYSETVLPGVQELKDELQKELDDAAKDTRRELDDAGRRARDGAREDVKKGVRDLLPF